MSVLSSLAIRFTADVASFDKGMQQVNRKLDNFSKTANTIGNTLMLTAIASQAAGLGMQIFQVTAEFEKMKAVLTNTLGSKGAAELAFDQIQSFASKTPYQVQELTDSFIKLTNRGFKPTTNEMRQLGDLASSTGKSFDQLSEALLDAMTSEFERLKEFGVKAKKEGDRVKFTFKGVTTEVKNTEEAIKKYVLSLGDAQGVSGSMAAVSETLTGKLSNLEDSYTKMLDTIGKGNTGPIAKAIEGLTKLTEAVTFHMSGTKDRAKEYVDTESIQGGIANLKKLQSVLADLQEQQRSEGFLSKVGEHIMGRDDEANKISIIAEAIRQQIAATNALVEAQQKGAQATREKIAADAEAAKQAMADLGILGRLRKEHKELSEQINTSNSEKFIFEAGLRQMALEKEIERVNNLAKAYNTLPKIQSIGLMDMTAKDFDPLKSIKDKADSADLSWTKQFEQASAAAQEMIDLTPLIEGFADTIGDAFTNLGDGSNGLKNFFGGITQTIGGFMGTLGKQMIAIGGARMSLDKLGLTGAPAIAAGITLMALSKVVSKSFSKGPFGGSGSGGGVVDPPFNVNKVPYASIRGRENLAEELGKVEFEIKGTSLIGAFNKAQTQRIRLA
ncbi:tape measure protein [Cesiribacter andamanensis]|uniref:Tape measure protein N-terminal domain-containing protein n=1 Tax=Cesiribacter andamanensis AMV16 TaxID=1279009 RepID=M7N5L3_9BACT|nr:tape measure protein [Cesiribacter andamanensis]EMR02521.1 hypothetical protein ADICEAN_02328 [Cesiribacter andamanensis AMV16]